jgi:hypothetical protein
MKVKKQSKFKERVLGFMVAIEMSNVLIFLAVVGISSIIFLIKGSNSVLIGALNIVFACQFMVSLATTPLRIVLEYLWERRLFGFPVGN